MELEYIMPHTAEIARLRAELATTKSEVTSLRSQLAAATEEAELYREKYEGKVVDCKTLINYMDNVLEFCVTVGNDPKRAPELLAFVKDFSDNMHYKAFDN